MIKTYRKTATIKAEQFDEDKWREIYDNAKSPKDWWAKSKRLGLDYHTGSFVITTLEGDMRVIDGDWIATGVSGEHWPIADDVFRKTYAELPAVPKEVAEYLEMCKQTDVSLYYAIHGIEFNMSDPWSPVINWMAQHTEDFARAWLDGYQIGEEDE